MPSTIPPKITPKITLGSRRIRSTKMLIFSLFAMVSLTVFFQNCGRVSMVNSKDVAPPAITMSQQLVVTTLNHPASISVQTNLSGSTLSFEQNSKVNSKVYPSGTAVLDPDTQKLTFTPNPGFRGSEVVNLYATHMGVTNLQSITFEVDNPTLTFRPALAVRAAECLVCHANVQGDLVSDFGFKSAFDDGPDLFLSVVDPTAPGASAYGIAQNGVESLSTATITGSLLIPKIDLTKIDATIQRSWYPLVSPVATATALPPSPLSLNPPITTFADYITKLEKPTNSGFLGVSEKSLVYIGAPLKTDLLSVAQIVPPARTNFFKNDNSQPDLAGLKHIQSGAGKSDYFTNDPSQPFVCEGDVFVDGVVMFDHLQLQTATGCRVYATHSVFIQGAITYLNEVAFSNLEITSTTGVYLGFGYCVDCADAVAFKYANTNSLATRLSVIKTTNSLKQFRTMSYDAAVAASIADFALTSDTPMAIPPATVAANKAAYQAYYASLGLNVTQFDASNTAVAEDGKTFDHLLLNAPIVMSRYTGDFQGMVVAEFAMWRLTQFTFTFDPVFTGVPLLPFLDFTKILQAQ